MAISFAAMSGERRLPLTMGMAAVALSASMSFNKPVGPPPSISHEKPISKEDITNITTGQKQLADQIKSMGATPQSSKPTSILGDVAKSFLGFREIGLTAAATAIGLPAGAVLAAGLIGTGSGLFHPLRDLNKAMAVNNPIHPKMRPNHAPTKDYSSWASQVAPLAPIMAAPAMMLSEFGSYKPKPPNIDALQRQFTEYDRLTRNLIQLDQGSGMDATKPGMLPESTFAKMSPTYRQGLYQTGRTDLSGIGAGQQAIRGLYAASSSAAAPAPSLG